MFNTMKALRALLAPAAPPRDDALAGIAASLDPLSLNIKQLGYALGRQLAAALPPRADTAAIEVGLASKLSTQADIESEWVAHWCAALGIPVIYHRKVWELAYVLQAFHDAGLLRPGSRGLGFGCGTEPIASYLAARGVAVTATDLLAADAAAIGWAASGQHADHLDKLFHPHLVDRASFDRQVDLRFVDMNAIPPDLSGYDLCWSICALEHLGSIDRGLRFIERAMETLRPGGIAVHTTEYNIRQEGPTLDQCGTVLFQRRHLEDLVDRLAAAGHAVAPLDLAIGGGPMDRFIDIPPWSHDLPAELSDWLGQPLHLKVALGGFPATCCGIIVRKGGG